MAGWIITLLIVAGVFGGVAYQRRRRYPRFRHPLPPRGFPS